ncbi:hypothetical protein [Solimonas soli]|uniref:hypothetical protein n=1 Tax=Solimonas soli TaxID=413479 RepID=UPI0004B3A92D|nr:hypothetical protein [Solimonas soli]
MTILRVVLAVAWMTILLVGVHAVNSMGLAPGGKVFFEDFAHPWRAQYNADFSIHLLLMAAWITYRERNLAVGLPLGALAVLLGGTYSLAYIFVATFRAGGNVETLLLGKKKA